MEQCTHAFDVPNSTVNYPFSFSSAGYNAGPGFADKKEESVSKLFGWSSWTLEVPFDIEVWIQLGDRKKQFLGLLYGDVVILCKFLVLKA